MANVYVSNFGGIKTSGFAIGLTFDDEVNATDLDDAITVSGDIDMIDYSPSPDSGNSESFHVIFTLPDDRRGTFSFGLTGYVIKTGNPTAEDFTIVDAEPDDLQSDDLLINIIISNMPTPGNDPNTDYAYRFSTADNTWYSWDDENSEWDSLASDASDAMAADSIWLGIGGEEGSDDVNTDAEASGYINDNLQNIDSNKNYIYFDGTNLKKISSFTSSIQIQFDTKSSINATLDFTEDNEYPTAAAENDGYYLVDGRNVITVPITFTADDMSAVTGIRYFSETDFVIQSLSGDDISEAETYVFATNEEHKFLLKIILPDNKKGSFQITFDGNIRREGIEGQETIFVNTPLELDFDSTVPYVEDFYMPDYRPGEPLYIRVKFNVPVRGLNTNNIVGVFDIEGVEVGTPHSAYKWVNMDGNTDEPVDSDGVWDSVVASDLFLLNDVFPTDRNYWQENRQPDDDSWDHYDPRLEAQIFLIRFNIPENAQGKLNVSLKGGSGSVIGPFK